MLEHGLPASPFPWTLTFALPQGRARLSFPIIVSRAIAGNIAAHENGPILEK
jgi:hypothetical protein